MFPWGDERAPAIRRSPETLLICPGADGVRNARWYEQSREAIEGKLRRPAPSIRAQRQRSTKLAETAPSNISPTVPLACSFPLCPQFLNQRSHMRVISFLSLSLLPVLLVKGNQHQYSQCYNILKPEAAFCRSYLHGALPPRSTSTRTVLTTFTPSASTKVTSTTATITTTFYTTVEQDFTITITDETTLSSTATSTTTTTFTVPPTQTVTVTETGANQRRNLELLDQRSSLSAVAKAVAGFSADIVTEVCFEILYGATIRPAATATVTKISTASTPTTTTTSELFLSPVALHTVFSAPCSD
jgi:hypothetical protein